MKVGGGKGQGLTGSWRSRHGLFIAFLLILAAVSLLLHLARGNRREKLLAAKTRYDDMVRAAPIDKVKAQRSRFYQSQYYLGYPIKISYAAAALVRDVCASAGQPVQVLDLRVVPGWQKLNFELTLAVAAETENAAGTVFTDFKQAMANRLGIIPDAISGPLKPVRTSGRGVGDFVFSAAVQVEMEW